MNRKINNWIMDNNEAYYELSLGGQAVNEQVLQRLER